MAQTLKKAIINYRKTLKKLIISTAIMIISERIDHLGTSN